MFEIECEADDGIHEELAVKRPEFALHSIDALDFNHAAARVLEESDCIGDVTEVGRRMIEKCKMKVRSAD